MKKVFNFILVTVLLSLVGCSKDDNPIITPQRILNATLNGKPLDFNSTFFNATLWDGKKLEITGGVDNRTMRLTLGEYFVEEDIKEGKYKIGTKQDNLETNIFYFDPDNIEDPNGSFYLGNYGCNVLSSTQVGEITITKFDTQNKIVSGTFSGTLFRWLDVSTGETETIDVTDGNFSVPYIEKTEELQPDRNVISARVNGYRFMSDDPGSPNSARSTSSGVDKITIRGYDNNFGRIQISVRSDVESGRSYSYKPDGSFKSLGVSFQNRINIPEDLLSNNPNQSNTSKISIINHDPDANIIEGNFSIENSEIEGRTITDGYFKVSYSDGVE